MKIIKILFAVTVLMSSANITAQSINMQSNVLPGTIVDIDVIDFLELRPAPGTRSHRRHYGKYRDRKLRWQIANGSIKSGTAYDGNCAWSMARGQKIKGKRSISSRNGARTFLFSSEKFKKQWDPSADRNIKRADSNWKRYSK